MWIPKHRRDVLVGKVAKYTREALKEVLAELGCEALAAEAVPDHVFVCPPRPAYVVNRLRGRRALRRFPELRARATRGRLWSRSYFVATVGNSGCGQEVSRSSGLGRNEES